MAAVRPNPEAMAEAEAIIQTHEEEKLPDLEFGGIYTGRICEILDRGVMIQLPDESCSTHNNQLSARKIRILVFLISKWETIQVKYYGRDPAQVRCVEQKALTVSSAAAVKNLLQSATKR